MRAAADPSDALAPKKFANRSGCHGRLVCHAHPGPHMSPTAGVTVTEISSSWPRPLSVSTQAPVGRVPDLEAGAEAHTRSNSTAPLATEAASMGRASPPMRRFAPPRTGLIPMILDAPRPVRMRFCGRLTQTNMILVGAALVTAINLATLVLSAMVLHKINKVNARLT